MKRAPLILRRSETAGKLFAIKIHSSLVTHARWATMESNRPPPKCYTPKLRGTGPSEEAKKILSVSHMRLQIAHSLVWQKINLKIKLSLRLRIFTKIFNELFWRLYCEQIFWMLPLSRTRKISLCYITPPNAAPPLDVLQHLSLNIHWLGACIARSCIVLDVTLKLWHFFCRWNSRMQRQWDQTDH